MSALDLPNGPFSTVFLGDYASSAQVLIRVEQIKSAELLTEITDRTPKEYIVALNQYVQSGPREITFGLQYYTDSDLPYLLCRNLSTTETDYNADSDPSRKYVLFLVNDETKRSWLFPEIQVELDLSVPYGKGQPTTTTCNFRATNLSLAYDLMSTGTAEEMNLLLPSARRPF